MDAQVLQAMARWPNVPACTGWLGLDARGHWYLRDETVQRQGDFPQPRGDRICHDALIAFIGRNYASDASGRWFFQNGPQRVYVALEVAPFILLCDGQGRWRTHTGIGVRSGGLGQDDSQGRYDSLSGDAGAPADTEASRLDGAACWLDDQDRLFVETSAGLALVRSADVPDAAGAIEQGRWQEPGQMAFAQMPTRFGYVLNPTL